ncbi:MAG TPA: 3-hydroxyacyl-ACP dehydratase FabZ family protein [Tepidisphaeraceae bacterium]
MLSTGATDKNAAPVKFFLIDRIYEVSPQRIVAAKSVTLAEEYLADHFPSFPVLPGVLMLEALTQAAGWLMHVGSDFSKSMAVLKEARNLRYGNFVAPGNTLRLEVELSKPTPTGAIFKATGLINNNQALTGRIEMAYFNLADRLPHHADTDARIIEDTKRRWAVLQSQGSVSI